MEVKVASRNNPTRPFTQTAEYRQQAVRLYSGNPLIEALPPILTPEEAAKRLSHWPEYLEQDRYAPLAERLHLTETVLSFFQPLSIHLQLEQSISRLLRRGYTGKRDPMSQSYYRDLDKQVSSIQLTKLVQHGSSPHGFMIIGISGIGKTTAVLRNLSLYPQVIFHEKYNGRPFSMVQVPWLMLQCPYDGSTKALAKSFFYEIDSVLGTSYERNYAGSRASTDDLVRNMARIAGIHCLGVLAIDEIQVLSQAKSGGRQQMLNFFLQLVNEIGMPLILIGTFQAYELFQHSLRLARRCTEEGDLVWDRMANDKEWALFVQSMWRYQYLHQPTPLTRELSDTLYDCTQGITDLVVKLYALSQQRAITTAATPDSERLTADIIRSAAADSFQLVNPILTRIREGKLDSLPRIEDLPPKIIRSRRTGSRNKNSQTDVIAKATV